MNTARKVATPVEILARLDTHKREPVVFLRSTLDSKGRIKLLRGDVEEQSHVDFYATTTPLSTKDEKIMCQRVADHFGVKVEDVNLNRRLPRTPRERSSMLKELPAPPVHTALAAPAAGSALPPGVTPEMIAAAIAQIMGNQAPAAPVAAPTQQQPEQAAQQPGLTLVHDANATNKEAAPAAQPQAAPEAAQQEAAAQPEQPENQAQRRRMTKKQKALARSEAARKGAATRAAKRAASIDKQAAPQGPQGDLPRAGETPAPMPQKADAPGVDKVQQPAAALPVVDARPDQVAQRIAEIRARMNAELDSVLESLTPHA